MKIRNNAKSGLVISTIIVVVAIVMAIIVNSIPNVDINTLNSIGKLQYDYKGETPIWKIICYIIIGVLLVLSWCVEFVMSRCHFCGRHIHYMNIFTMYCPYCGKSLDT